MKRICLRGILVIAVGVVFFFSTRALAVYLATGTLGQPSLTVGCQNYGAKADGFAAPLDVDVDTVNHRMYVSDISNSRVLVFNLDSSNEFTDRTADFVLGQANFTTCVRQSVSSSTLAVPRSLVHDDARQLLYVADAGNHRVLVFDTSVLTNGVAAVSVLGQPNFISAVDNCTAQSATTICGSNSVELDTVGQRLFVAEANSRVSVWDVASITAGEAALAVLGQPDFSSALTGLTQNRFSFVHGVAYDPVTSYLFVSDDLNGRVMVFDAASASLGENALYVLGAGADFTTVESVQLSQKGLGRTLGLSVDSAGHRLFVGDFSQNLVKVWDFDDFPLANAASESYVLGAPNFTTNGSSIINASTVPGVHGMQYEPATGKLYVANPHNRISTFDVSSITNGEAAVDAVGQTTSGGAAIFTKSGANNGPNAQGLVTARGVALDTVNHRLFVSDTANHRIIIHSLDTNNNLVDDTADFVLGQTDMLSNTSSTSQNKFVGTDMFAIAIDMEHNRLYAAFNAANRVLMWDLSGGITNGMNATAVLGQPDFTSTTGAVTQAGAVTPVGVAYDSVSDYLYVTNDSSGNRVMVYDTSGSVTTGMNAKAVLGQSSWTTNTAGTSATTLRRPYSLCMDEVGRRLFVVEFSNNRVVQYDITTVASGQAAVGVLGQSDFSTLTPATTQIGMSGPVGCAYDGVHNRLYALESTNNRIMVYDVATVTNGEPAVGVLGQDNFTTATVATTVSAGQFTGSGRFLAYDSANSRLWYGDSPNSRVLRYQFLELPAVTLSRAPLNSSYTQSLGELNAQGTVTFTLASGSLPAGLSLGSLTGTPTETGTFTFVVLASDSNGTVGVWWDQQSYSLTVDPPGTPVAGSYVPPGTNPSATPTPSGIPAPSAFPDSLRTDDLIRAVGDIDIFILNQYGYKRLFISPPIFNLYFRLGWNKVKEVSVATRDAFITSGLFRNCETNEAKVYSMGNISADAASLYWVNISGTQAIADNPNFFKKVFCINTAEQHLYGTGEDYTSETEGRQW